MSERSTIIDLIEVLKLQQQPAHEAMSIGDSRYLMASLRGLLEATEAVAGLPAPEATKERLGLMVSGLCGELAFLEARTGVSLSEVPVHSRGVLDTLPGRHLAPWRDGVA